jgi:ribosomal protein S1
MKIKRCAGITILFMSTFALAHGDYQHVMGTVTKVSQNSITVQTTTNESVEVATSPDTKFSKGDAAIDGRELKVGDRVVIHAKKTTDGKLVAHTVQIGAAKPAAASH